MKITPYVFENGYVNFRYNFNNSDRAEITKYLSKLYRIKCLLVDNRHSKLNSKFFSVDEWMLPPVETNLSDPKPYKMKIRYAYKGNKYYKLDLIIEFQKYSHFKIYDGLLFHTKGLMPKEFSKAFFLKRVSNESIHLLDNLISSLKTTDICDNCYEGLKYEMQRCCYEIYRHKPKRKSF